MRLVATVDTLEQATRFRALLSQEGIESLCETGTPKGKATPEFYVWVTNEDHLEKAVELFEAFKKEPGRAPDLPPPPEEIKEPSPENRPPPLPRASMQSRARRGLAPVTKILIAICILFYIYDWYSLYSLAKKEPAVFANLRQTELQGAMMYNNPPFLQAYRAFLVAHPELAEKKPGELSVDARIEYSKIMQMPIWAGVYGLFVDPGHPTKGPGFEQISQGQVWRLLTPIFMHVDLLHILFNMLWLWFLGRFVERNVKAWRYLAMIVIIGVLSNTCQYLMSGPNFFGFSGVISGFAGFIFIRQRCAPWEDYPLPRMTLIFLGVFIFGMALLQVISFLLVKAGHSGFMFNIANTAHISGLIVGMILAKIRAFEAQ